MQPHNKVHNKSLCTSMYLRLVSLPWTRLGRHTARTCARLYDAMMPKPRPWSVHWTSCPPPTSVALGCWTSPGYRLPRHVLRRERGAARARAVHRETQTDELRASSGACCWTSNKDADEDPFVMVVSYYDCAADEYGESCDNAYKYWYGDEFEDDIYVDDFDFDGDF